MEILLRPNILTILFDRLHGGKEEKRSILSRIIRNLYYDNSKGTDAVEPFMERYVKMIPSFSNSKACVKHLAQIMDFYRPNGTLKLH